MFLTMSVQVNVYTTWKPVLDYTNNATFLSFSVLAQKKCIRAEFIDGLMTSIYFLVLHQLHINSKWK